MRECIEDLCRRFHNDTFDVITGNR